MPRWLTRVLAVVLAASVANPPALGIVWCPSVGRLAFYPAPEIPPGGNPTADRPAPSVDSPTRLAADREAIARQLIEIGRTSDAARNTASRLTAEDLEVLLANPEMMQVAGAVSQMAVAYLIGGLIVAGIVILIVAGSGSVSIGV